MIHLGPIAAGRQVSKDDQLRQDFATRFGILAFDTEYDAVIESVFGNRKDCYTIVRGISDYKDGTRKKEWQPYASLAAAAFTKALICSMPASVDDWESSDKELFSYFPFLLSLCSLQLIKVSRSDAGSEGGRMIVVGRVLHMFISPLKNASLSKIRYIYTILIVCILGHILSIDILCFSVAKTADSSQRTNLI